MVGIVVVSHSDALARGVVQLARQMGGEQVALEAAGGTEEQGVLGTDANRIAQAIGRAMSPDGVLVLMDLGSALLSSELALELLGETEGPVRLCHGPLVEGAVAAAAAAAGGAALEQVAAEAVGALAMKASQLQDTGPEPPSAGPQPPSAGPQLQDTRPGQGPSGTPPDAESVIVLRNRIGLHARPAARVVELARRFDARLQITKQGASDRPANATSLTGLLALAGRLGDRLVVRAWGPQAAAAVAALEALAASGFGEGVVEETAGVQRRTGVEGAPGGQQAAGVAAVAGGQVGAPGPGAPPTAPAPGELLAGVPASGGAAAGPARLLDRRYAPPLQSIGEDPERERERLERALKLARAAIASDRRRVAARAGEDAAAIFDAHLALLDDEALLEPARAAIASGASAERAFYDAASALAERYRQLPVALLAQRAVDVADVGARVVDALGERKRQTALSERERKRQAAPGGIVLTGELTPAQAARLRPGQVLGVATAHGTATAHAAILARALGLPAVVGLGERLLSIPDGTLVLVDGDAGTLQVDPPSARVAEAAARRERAERRRRQARRAANEPGATRDGHRVEVFANIGSLRDAQHAVALGAEGVGLLRTEFLFAQRPELPSEDEQASALQGIAEVLQGRPLTVRTLDAGADKPIPALRMAPEPNPFLGVRGIRAALARPAVLETQLRAILRVAAAGHPIRAMLPMVATARELADARAILERARAALGASDGAPLGIMVEIPAAALRAAQLAEQADFFSIGTNDLTQYTMAADRSLETLASFSAGPQPAVLALIEATVRGAARFGRPVAVCGELAGDPATAVLLVGLGVDELSVAPELVPDIKATLRAVDLPDARAAAAAALDASDAAAARAHGAALL